MENPNPKTNSKPLITITDILNQTSTKSSYFTDRGKQLPRPSSLQLPKPKPKPKSKSKFTPFITDYLLQEFAADTPLDYLLHNKYLDAVSGFGFGYAAIKSWPLIKSTSSALRKLRNAPIVPISHLRQGEELVAVTGFVQPAPRLLTSLLGSGTIQSVDPCVKGVASVKVFSAKFDVDWLRWVPRVRVDGKIAPFVLSDTITSSYVNVNYRPGCLPLSAVYIGNPFIKSGGDDKLLLELMLPVGKQLTAVGRISSRGIEACDDLPYYLSDLTKDQMVKELAIDKGILILTMLVCGSLSVLLLAHTFRRYWRKYKSSR